MEVQLQHTLKVEALLEEIKRLNNVVADLRVNFTLSQRENERLVQEKEDRAREARPVNGLDIPASDEANDVS